ncbi:uncharacterized protein C8R40DRAFT_285402 [Lentinula edodes]|uniref:uncharacterized protein n=1 Tax=Lentinula edodes TaxID=5353 RepID=UPI001E8C9DFE|nr:uncharacterized protein C8R40DRAFT_285402 [Lentinula edodes]KAH7880830.1 hypothetical protein C8R40DRAFT_285402 [Lentinula edodes]
MRRPDPRSGPLGTPDIPSTFQFNPTAGVIPFLPQSHTSSNTPTSSRGTTAEPAFVARQQQDGQSPYPHTPQITPSPSFQAPSFMQTGAMMPSAFSLNPHLLQMVPNQFQDQNFFMAFADVYRANMMNLAALSQFHQPQQPSYSFPEAPPDTTPAPVPAPASSKAKSTESHSGSSMASSSLPSKELSRNDKGKQKASPPPSSSSTRSFSEPQTPIFTRNGKSVMFFVQIDLSQRHDLVNQIKVRYIVKIFLVMTNCFRKTAVLFRMS